MEGEYVITHLLQIEETAAKIVADANAAAEKLIAGGERESRERFDAEYKRRRGELEAESAVRCRKLEENYQTELRGYKDSIDSLKTDQTCFNSAAARLLGISEPGAP
ncbi:MAG: hypothetical protein LBG72_06425 [Spirochaetaceae bacterium]|jgi:vacuolar-type H+-ATPase subunit E/Vma4|nr:hypothetical protein [Spirochaetaceae bacterium]